MAQEKRCKEKKIDYQLVKIKKIGFGQSSFTCEERRQQEFI
jgi:hypothetical protein